MKGTLRAEAQGGRETNLSAKEITGLPPVLANGPGQAGLHRGGLVSQIVACTHIEH